MLVAVVKRKLRSSSIIETIVAVLILLLSFSAGMVLYNQVLQSTYSGIKLRANLEQGLIADSLVNAGLFENGQASRQDMRYEWTYTRDEQYPGLLVMALQVYDEGGNKLSELKKLVRRKDGE